MPKATKRKTTAKRKKAAPRRPKRANSSRRTIFEVDGQPYELSQRFITGAQLRKMAHVEPEYRIFFEKHREQNEKNGHSPDLEIRNRSSVDLTQPGDEKFYTLHAPSMDIN